MSKNRGVVYVKPGLVEVRDIADPKFEDPHGRKINHAVILKIVSTNICGSDQHMVRGRTSATAGLVLGHEITGEVIEKGVDVEFIDDGTFQGLELEKTIRHGMASRAAAPLSSTPTMAIFCIGSASRARCVSCSTSPSYPGWGRR